MNFLNSPRGVAGLHASVLRRSSYRPFIGKADSDQPGATWAPAPLQLWRRDLEYVAVILGVDVARQYAIEHA